MESERNAMKSFVYRANEKPNEQEAALPKLLFLLPRTDCDKESRVKDCPIAAAAAAYANFAYLRSVSFPFLVLSFFFSSFFPGSSPRGRLCPQGG
jgi:hypothetical protein